MQRIELKEALMEEERKEEEEMEKKPHLVNLPSFGAAPGDRLFSSAVDREVDGDDDDDDDDFEFAIAAAGPDTGPAITADELFSDGLFLPSYPLFNLDLLPPVADPPPHPPSSGEAAARSGSISSSSSTEAEDGGFCAWAPRSAPQSPERLAKKSASTGSSSSSPARRWRIRDLVVGRSSSDGKDKFLFLSSPPNPNPNPNPNPSPNPNPNPNPKKKGTKVVKEMDMVTAHKLYYAKGGGGGGDRGRRSFLPYRQELFGFFGARTQHPF